MITGHKLRLARQLKNISVKELCDKIDMDNGSYLRIERGETKLTEEKTERILQALNMDREFVERIQEFQQQTNYNNTFHDNSINQNNVYNTAEEERSFLKEAIVMLKEQNSQLMELLNKLLNK